MEVFYTKQVFVFCFFFLGFSLNFIPHSGGPVHDVERIVTDCKYILNCYFRLVIACVVVLGVFFVLFCFLKMYIVFYV